MRKVGVLALQGAFREHVRRSTRSASTRSRCSTPEQLSGVDASFLPGGESTTITKLLHTAQLIEPIRAALADGLPVFGTCAGLIVLGDDQRDQHGVRRAAVVRRAHVHGVAQRLRDPARLVRGGAANRRDRGYVPRCVHPPR